MDTGAQVRSDGVEITSIGSLYKGPMEKKYWSSSRGKEKYPYPIGFNATRFHGGHCYIMEVSEGPRGPLFRVTCEEGISCAGQTPSAPWDDILKKRHVGAKKVLLRNSCSSIDGPEMFGFTSPLVQRLCRDLVVVTSGAAEQSDLIANSTDPTRSLKENDEWCQSGEPDPKEQCEPKSKGAKNAISPAGRDSSERNPGTTRAQKLTPIKRPKGSKTIMNLEETAQTSKGSESSTEKTNLPKGYWHKFQPLTDILSKELEEVQAGASKKIGNSYNDGQENDKGIPPTKRPRTTRLKVGSFMEDVNQETSPQMLTRTTDNGSTRVLRTDAQTGNKNTKVESSVDSLKDLATIIPLHPGTARTKKQKVLFSPVAEECNQSEAARHKDDDLCLGKDKAGVCPDSLDAATADNSVLKNASTKKTKLQLLKTKVPESVQCETDVDLTSGEGVLSIDLMCPVAEDVTNQWSESSFEKQNPSQSNDPAQSTQQDGVFLLLEACKLAGDCVPTSPDCPPQGKVVGDGKEDQPPLNISMRVSDVSVGTVCSESPSSTVLSSGPILNSVRQFELFQKESLESQYQGQQALEVTLKGSVEPGPGSLVPHKVIHEGISKPMVLSSRATIRIMTKQEAEKNHEDGRKFTFGLDKAPAISVMQTINQMDGGVLGTALQYLEPSKTLEPSQLPENMSPISTIFDGKPQLALLSTQEKSVMTSVMNVEKCKVSEGKKLLYCEDILLADATQLEDMYRGATANKDVNRDAHQHLAVMCSGLFNQTSSCLNNLMDVPQLVSSSCKAVHHGIVHSVPPSFQSGNHSEISTTKVGKGMYEKHDTLTHGEEDCIANLLCASELNLEAEKTVSISPVSRVVDQSGQLDAHAAASFGNHHADLNLTASEAENIYDKKLKDMSCVSSHLCRELINLNSELPVQGKEEGTAPEFALGRLSRNDVSNLLIASVSIDLLSDTTVPEEQVQGILSLGHEDEQKRMLNLETAQGNDIAPNYELQLCTDTVSEGCTDITVKLDLNSDSRLVSLKPNGVAAKVKQVEERDSCVLSLGESHSRYTIEQCHEANLCQNECQGNTTGVCGYNQTGCCALGTKVFTGINSEDKYTVDHVLVRKDKDMEMQSQCENQSGNNTKTSGIQNIFPDNYYAETKPSHQVDLPADSISHEEHPLIQDKHLSSEPNSFSESQVESDSVGRELTKSMITLLLPQAGPLMHKGCKKRNNSCSSAEHVISPVAKDLSSDTTSVDDCVVNIRTEFPFSIVGSASEPRFDTSGSHCDTLLGQPSVNELPQAIEDGLGGRKRKHEMSTCGDEQGQSTKFQQVIMRSPHTMNIDQTPKENRRTSCAESKRNIDSQEFNLLQLQKPRVDSFLDVSNKDDKSGNEKTIHHLPTALRASNLVGMEASSSFSSQETVIGAPCGANNLYPNVVDKAKENNDGNDQEQKHYNPLIQCRQSWSDEMSSIKADADIILVTTDAIEDASAVITDLIRTDREKSNRKNDFHLLKDHQVTCALESHLQLGILSEPPNAITDACLKNKGEPIVPELLDYESLPSIQKEMVDLEHLESVICIEHPIPVSAIVLNVRGNDIRLCICCGKAEEKMRRLFVYEVHIKEDTELEPTLLGVVYANLQEVSVKAKTAYEEAGIRFTPSGQEIILLDNFQLTLANGSFNTDANEKEGHAVNIVSIDKDLGSRILVKLDSNRIMRCLLVPAPDTIVAAGDNGCINCWKMDKSWRICKERFSLTVENSEETSFSVITRLLAVPGQPSIIIGCNLAGNFSVWDTSRRARISSFHIPNHCIHSAHFVEVSEPMIDCETGSTFVKKIPTVECPPLCLLVMVATAEDPSEKNEAYIKGRNPNNTAQECKTMILKDGGVIVGPTNKDSADAASVVTMGHYGVMGTAQGRVIMWNVMNGQKVFELFEFAESSIVCMAASPASCVLAIGGGSGQVVLYIPKVTTAKSVTQ